MHHWRIESVPNVERIEDGSAANVYFLATDGTPIVLTIAVHTLRELKADIEVALSASPFPNPDR
jgi:hypothetical protein